MPQIRLRNTKSGLVRTVNYLESCVAEIGDKTPTEEWVQEMINHRKFEEEEEEKVLPRLSPKS